MTPRTLHKHLLKSIELCSRQDTRNRATIQALKTKLENNPAFIKARATLSSHYDAFNALPKETRLSVMRSHVFRKDLAFQLACKQRMDTVAKLTLAEIRECWQKATRSIYP